MSALEEILLEILGAPSEEILLETTLKDDLKCDSTMALELVFAIRKQFGIDVEQPTSMRGNKDWSERLETVGKMYNYILNNLPADSPFLVPEEEKTPA